MVRSGTSTGAWTNKANGTSCGTGLICTAGSCAPPPCGKFDLVVDDFGDSQVAPGLWVAGQQASTTIAEAAGVVTCGLAVNQAAEAWAYYSSDYEYDFINSQIALTVDEVTNPAATGAMTFLRLTRGAVNLQIDQTGGVLSAKSVDAAGTHRTLAAVPYDPSAHRRWRLREAGGTVYFETSDGAEWAELATGPTPPEARLLRVAFGAGTWEPVAAPGRARFSAFNTGVSPGRACPAASLKDSFSGSTLGPEWERSYAVGSASYQISEAAILLPGASAWSEAALGSSRVFDLSSSSAAIAVPVMVATLPGVWTSFSLFSRAANGSLEFVQEGGTLVARRVLAGVSTIVASKPYDSTAHRAWRIREQGGRVTWQTYNGTAWTDFAEAANPFPVTTLELQLKVGTKGAVLNAGEVHYDNLNLVL